MNRFIISIVLWLVGIAQMTATNIPTLYINTNDSSSVTSREVWKENVHIRLVLPDGTVAYNSAQASIKGRGHSTFAKPKKPYALKLESASALLGMASNRRWVLLANFMDHSLVRNSLAFAIAKETRLEWTPDSRFVDVVFNGKPQGCYLLCENIRFHKNRINLDDKKDFLLEVDSYFDEPHCFRTHYRQLPVNVKEPEDASPAQLAYIQNYLDTLETLLYKGEPDNLKQVYEKYIDVESFVDWWIVHELTQNAEPNGPRSCYLYKRAEGKLKAGPVWDFDLAFITVGLDRGGDLRPSRLNRTDVVLLTGDSLYNPKALWYDRLLQDPDFRHRVSTRWKELVPRFRTLTDRIDRWEALIETSAQANERLWLGQDPARFDTCTTFHSSIKLLKQVYRYRIESLSRLLDKGQFFK